jgi:hypothetical protein
VYLSRHDMISSSNNHHHLARRLAVIAALFSIVILITAPPAPYLAQNLIPVVYGSSATLGQGHDRGGGGPRYLDTQQAYNDFLTTYLDWFPGTGGWADIVADGINQYHAWKALKKSIDDRKKCMESKSGNPDWEKKKKELMKEVENQEKILKELSIMKALWEHGNTAGGKTWVKASPEDFKKFAKAAKLVISQTLKKMGAKDFDKAIADHMKKISDLSNEACKCAPGQWPSPDGKKCYGCPESLWWTHKTEGIDCKPCKHAGPCSAPPSTGATPPTQLKQSAPPEEQSSLKALQDRMNRKGQGAPPAQGLIPDPPWTTYPPPPTGPAPPGEVIIVPPPPEALIPDPSIELPPELLVPPDPGGPTIDPSPVDPVEPPQGQGSSSNS